MIYTFIAYDQEGDLGSAYNRCMDLLKNDDDWAIFLDHDAMFVQPNWYEIVSEALKNSEGYGCLTCITNRVGSPWQRVGGIDPENHDIRYHRQVGKAVIEQILPELSDVTSNPSLMSGVLMVINKKCWDSINGCSSGFLGVDNKIHERMRDKGYKVGLIPNLYVYHWYRGELEINKARIKYT